MTCPFKHTSYQPAGPEWHCPSCGKGKSDGTFYISDSPNHECEELHQTDSVLCMNCGWIGSGTTAAKRLAAAANLVQCPTCLGKGVVKK